MKKSVLLLKSNTDFFVFSPTFTNFIAENKTLKSIDKTAKPLGIVTVDMDKLGLKDVVKDNTALNV